ncbi:MAG: BrnT family toxin [Chloroflexi bacterium]|nr:BrnT family toxin [Chloroflexota bacterium]
MSLIFEWDDRKAKTNARKHGVTFAEAATIFSDPYLITFGDEEHSESEDRFISIGQSERGRVLLVVHADREHTIRLISCRKATAQERMYYER